MLTTRLSGRLPFEDKDPLQVESKILMAKFDPTKLYPNVSQSASAFLKKMLSSYPWLVPTKVDSVLPVRKNKIQNFKFCVFSGPVRPHETASRTPGCRIPTWWSWGDRLSPSPPADSKSSWWNNSAVAQRAPQSTKCCCAPTRAHPSPLRLGLRRMFPAQSEITVDMLHQTWVCRVWSAYSDAKQQLFASRLLCELLLHEKCQPAKWTGKHTGDKQTAGYS